MNNNVINHINIIDALYEQISALLDLLQGCDESTDISTVHTAAEMAVTMLDEIDVECQNWYKEDKAESDEYDDAFAQVVVDKMCKSRKGNEMRCKHCNLNEAIDEVF